MSNKRAEEEHQFRYHKAHKDLLGIKIAIKVTLDNFRLLEIENINYYQREEMKTILDIFQALCSPVFDHSPGDVFAKKEKKAILVKIDVLRMRLAENRSRYFLQFNAQEYREGFARSRIEGIMAAILALLHQTSDPRWPITTQGRQQLIVASKQVLSFQSIVHLFPSMTTLSREFLDSEFAKTYIRLGQILQTS